MCFHFTLCAEVLESLFSSSCLVLLTLSFPLLVSYICTWKVLKPQSHPPPHSYKWRCDLSDSSLGKFLVEVGLALLTLVPSMKKSKQYNTSYAHSVICFVREGLQIVFVCFFFFFDRFFLCYSNMVCHVMKLPGQKPFFFFFALLCFALKL